VLKLRAADMASALVSEDEPELLRLVDSNPIMSTTTSQRHRGSQQFDADHKRRSFSGDSRRRHTMLPRTLTSFESKLNIFSSREYAYLQAIQ